MHDWVSSHARRAPEAPAIITPAGTLAYAELDLARGVVHYACAGHLPPLVVTEAGQATFLWDGRSRRLGRWLPEPVTAAAARPSR